MLGEHTYSSRCLQRKCYDAGKKVPGIKRHIAVDTQGLPHAIADITDRAGTLATFSETSRQLVGSDERAGWAIIWDIHLLMPYRTFWGLR